MDADLRRPVCRGTVVLFAALLAYAVVGLLTTPAAQAHHKSDHTNGHVDESPDGSDVTEDSDTDGVANTPDPAGDADNQHPSGKDRHDDNGLSGRSQSDPDGMENGGADKPGGSGGVDQLDQDGNNGCGNDDDFEDDNNGNCGGPGHTRTAGEADESTTMATRSTAAVKVVHSDAASDGAVVFASVAAVEYSAIRSVATAAGTAPAASGSRLASVLARGIAGGFFDSIQAGGARVELPRSEPATVRSARLGTGAEQDDDGVAWGELARTGAALSLLAIAGIAALLAARALRRVIADGAHPSAA